MVADTKWTLAIRRYASKSMPARKLSTLLANDLARAERRIQPRLDENAKVASTALEPCGERFLVRERSYFHRSKFRNQQSIVRAADAKDDQCSGITNHCGAHNISELL